MPDCDLVNGNYDLKSPAKNCTVPRCVSKDGKYDPEVDEAANCKVRDMTVDYSGWIVSFIITPLCICGLCSGGVYYAKKNKKACFAEKEYLGG